MHLLMTKGYEDGNYFGLDLIKGNVKKLKKNSLNKVPHIGWNEVVIKEANNPLIKNIKTKSELCNKYSSLYYFFLVGLFQN